MEKHAKYLNKTFLVTTADALVKPFKFEEDRLFLASMMDDRSATFGVHNIAFSKKCLEKQKKCKEIEKRKVHDTKVMQDQFATTSSENLHFSSSGSETDYLGVEEPTCSTMTTPHTKLQKTGAQLQVPHDILSKKSVVEVITRCNISPAAASALCESFILEFTYVGEEDLTRSELLSKFSLSYASCDRYKRKVNYE